ncbi:ABC transporter G family member 39 [Apostasia shenzhenica]|uniref:ABC transporter G family member 39 n=1 Tax=Apostasia shenzhenica TaxID=1088818 RepID=A0A2I0BH93_9ASPA|nr:ABC transporter G family member 39 [Apostasia shenzhenica]
MAAILGIGTDDPAVTSSSRRSWISPSFHDPADVFRRSSAPLEDDEEKLKWAALEKLPTYDRMRTGILRQFDEDGKAVSHEVDLDKLGLHERKILLDRIMKIVEEDNERFLKRLRDRINQVGLELPKLEVRFQNLSVEADAYVGSRALPTLLNAAINTLEGLFGFVQFSQSKKRVKKVLTNVSGILKPSRMTLLLGPPGSGKTTLLLALAGKLDCKLKVSGKITYCGHELSEFYPQRTSAYISQHDIHIGEMTVRETFDFSGRCLGVGTRYELMAELSRRERDAGIKPDPEIDAFMKAMAVEGRNSNLATDYILKVLGLDICSDIIVGDEMRRGISGGQKKRVTTGEMLAGPARALFMDEISTGLDSSTTFQIVKFIKQMVHVMDGTVLVSLLQPAPETFELFDDVILLSEGQIVYQGPRENILEFFEFMGFKCPERKGVADFLQEVTSRKDQEQYWFRENQPYHYIPVSEFSNSFKSFYVGERLAEEMKIPYDKSMAHPSALATKKYGMSGWELCKACFAREWLLMKRNSFIYIFKTTQVTILAVVTTTVFLRTNMHHETIADGWKYFGALFFSLVNMMFNGMAELPLTILRLPVFYKQRDFLFYPPWAFGLSYSLLKIPLSLLESGIWLIITYYGIGFSPSVGRLFRQLLAYFSVHQMALSLFRFIAAVGRTMVIANTFGFFALLVIFVLGGFVISKDNIQPWWIWGYWISPMMYGQTAIALNEFLDPRWSHPNNDPNINEPTIGKAILKSRAMFVNGYWYWICIGALYGFAILFNILFILALTYLNPIGNSQSVISNEDEETRNKQGQESMMEIIPRNPESINVSAKPITADTKMIGTFKNSGSTRNMDNQVAHGMVLPFQPLSLVFDHINYYVDMPSEMKKQGVQEKRLQLLCNVSGAFRPGILTALVGVSGAGKTTLMDVLAGRKTGGYIEGDISVGGYPKKQETFARISGYCEQNDIHSPHITVHESLTYSAWLRLSPEIDQETRKMFVGEIIDLIELNPLKDALVGLPGIDGLSTEQRKRLTIAVELVANPSIIFMDEPTSGLDARAAAIVMRTVRNTVNTGRTVVCTIHQPSIDIFETFDELLLMRRGGEVIYAGELGHHSCKLVQYFESISGVPKISEGYNPATWMLDITSPSIEAQLNLDFAEVYSCSSLYLKNQELVKELSIPKPGSVDLAFSTKYAQNFVTQCTACFWKQHWSYWRDPQYNAIRFFSTLVTGLLFGTIFWGKGQKIDKQQDVLNLIGAIYAAVFFHGAANANTVQPVVAIERTVFYRERAAGMFSPFAYTFAQLSIEAIYNAVQSLVYSLLLFSMIDFGWKVDKFLWWFFIIFMCFIYFTLYGMMAVAITPSYQVASIISSFFYSLWNLFCGFIVTRKCELDRGGRSHVRPTERLLEEFAHSGAEQWMSQMLTTEMMPAGWRWMFWANPVALTIYGLVVSQIGEAENMVQIPGEVSVDVKTFLKQLLGYEHDFLGYLALAHVGFIVVFTFIFAYAIKFFNFQKR